MKKCTKCNEAKPLAEFFKSGKYPSGKEKNRGSCKACTNKYTANWRIKNRAEYNDYMTKYRIQKPDKRRATEIKKLYGLLPEQLTKMVQEQNNKCKICNRPPQGKRPLAIDHCHKSGRVRGLLCYRCNRSVALLDDQELLEKAIAYIKS